MIEKTYRKCLGNIKAGLLTGMLYAGFWLIVTGVKVMRKVSSIVFKPTRL